MARTSLNEHCSAVLLKKLPKKLGDPGKFLIPCDFPGMAECLALADLSASINLMPFFVWERLSLPDLTPTCMTLELADRSISRPVGVTEDVYVKVSSFHFSADFVVVDFDADPRVPLILEISFLKTERALIDVFEGELTLRVGKEAITFNLDQTSRYSANCSDMTAKRIDVIDIACEEYSQEVLGFSDVIASSNPTPYYDPIVSTTSLTLTPFGNNDFLLEEVDAFLAIENDPTSPKVDQSYLDPEGDILLLKAFLNDDPSLPPPTQGNYLPEVRKELKICEAKSDKSSIDEPSEVELKDLPPHLEYAFLEGNDKLPVIIAKDLSVEEKTALITVLKSHKRAIAWKLSDVKGIDPEFCTHKILMEETLNQRSNIREDPWVSPVHCVPKNGSFTVVENEDNELIPNRLVMGWRVCIDYRKLNKATHKEHFPLPFMDQMLEILARNQYYCFLDDFFGYFQISIDLKDHEKTTFTCPYKTFAYRRMPFGLCNALGTFQRYMMAIFHDMIEKTMEVFMDDFFVFGNSFQSCLSHLERMLKRCEDTNLCLNWKKSHFMVKEVFENSFQSCLSHLERMLKRCEDTNLCLNWEKSHFMVKDGIVLGHKLSKQGIEVDKAKVDVITKFLSSNNCQGLITCLLEKDTLFIFSKECVKAVQTLKRKLTEAPILNAPDWDIPFELMCDASDFAIGAILGKRQDKHFWPIHYASKTMTKNIMYTDHSALKYPFAKKDSKARFLRWVLLLQEFTFKVIDTKGSENLDADHLYRLENPHQNMFDPKEINESFPLETLNLVFTRGNSSTPWFADFSNYHGGILLLRECRSNRKKFFKDVNSKFMRIKSSEGVYTARKSLTFSRLATMNRPRDIIAQTTLPRRTVGENRASWSEQLDDALWAFRTAYKTPIGCTLYKLVYGKACHLPIELEHKAYWAVKHANFNLQTASDHRKV
uniref:Reverse transcriptase domain-containing protein n=1 Tax=Tanacetum cinerariifolium TaxID=118510 RepID=A0A699HNI8_TANCI|nr:reverse transcriptase domain-containing protein [Tanacetum cinerariifolium]